MVTVFILLLASYSITTGFSYYVAQTELASLDTIPHLLEKLYVEKGNWQNVFSDSSLMNDLFGINENLHRPRTRDVFEEVPRPPGILPIHEPYPPPPFPPFRVDLFHRIGVFDSSGKLLWGTNKAKDSRAMIPLLDGAALIGSFRVAVSETLDKEIETNFIAEQSRTLIFLCLFAVAIAFTSAKFMSKHFVDAIDLIVHFTRKLRSGELSTRIELLRSDELGQLAQDLNMLASTLEQHDQSHKKWITDTSHELRTPVAVLRAQVEALQDGVQEPNQATLDVLHNQVMILGKLIDDLHDLARFDLNQLKFHFVPTDIPAILIESIESFEDRFKLKSIRVDTSSICNAHCVLSADPARLRQLFENLFENSLRYTDEGGQFVVSARNDGTSFVICVEDSAPGVPAELLTSIFERFYRIESSRNRMYGGTGLGLSICKIIAEGHKASIRALPSPLGGLKIELRLSLQGDG